ncbi:TPA: hypothetical protein KC759_004182 [Escherichia coli O146]|uniref:hypothetical protein n=1 Tax=Escherichia coli TaxID=562 RepID=UPI00053ADDB5|nr:hypothetical protein [Escherichia coli]EIO0893568.1 hypothetical protein [Salmonella enterica subsp. enterica serovar Weltevreden]HBC3161648.1 hypothetical protein [Escherichia coli O146]EEC9022131.1 hypothetical protein [Escherichia coli]EED1399786.1 hypothetical protein [Escherichia coli]EEQ8735811.1 hypothetical protein [Escherichia coli]
MQVNKTADNFIFIKKHIYRIFQWMHETSLINNGNTPVTDRLIVDIRWMLEHHYYPSPGQVDRIISVLRETKLRLVRENNNSPERVEDIQQQLNTLKDIHKFLILNTNYKPDGDIISLTPSGEWKTSAIILSVVAVILLTFASVCHLSGLTPYFIYTAGIIFYALATPVLTMMSTQPEKNILLLFAFGGVIIFTLLSLC